MNKNILIIAAHSDDEAIGCGATIARHHAEGDCVHVVYMTDGVSSRTQTKPEQIQTRENASVTAQKILGIQQSYSLGLPDNKMDSLPLLDIVKKLTPIIEAFKPYTIYTHHNGDLNIDHQITQKAVLTACRPQPHSSIKKIYSFEIASSSEWNNPNINPFTPQYYVDISAYLEYKLKALHAYQNEMRDPPHSRSIQHIQLIARHRGHSIGIPAAEAFMILRHIH